MFSYDIDLSTMFESSSNYTFHQSDRLGNDVIDNTQRTLQNTAYLTRVMSDFTPDKMANTHMDFATQYPGIMVSGTNGGTGLGEFGVDQESNLLWKSEGQRPLEKLQLFPRTFLTVPYLGRGSCDPIIEAQLLQGENIRGKKSVTTVMEKNFMPLDKYPLDEDKRSRTSNGSNAIEELALDGWARGGATTRNMEENYFSKKSKPTNPGL